MEDEIVPRKFKRRHKPNKQHVTTHGREGQVSRPTRSTNPSKKSSKKHGKDILEENEEELGYQLRDEEDNATQEPIRFVEVTQTLPHKSPPKKKNKKSRAKSTLFVSEAPVVVMKHIGLEMQANVDYMAALEQFAMLPRLGIDFETLDLLGIQKDVEWYLEALGPTKFVTIYQPTYGKLAREFLAMVTLSYPKTKTVKAKEGILAFTAKGKSYTLSIEDVCDILGLECHDRITFGGSEAHYDEWLKIGNDRIKPDVSKASKITHLAIHCVYYLLSQLIFSRNEYGVVKQEEFYVLITPFVENSEKVSLASLLARRMVQIKHDAAKEKLPKGASSDFGGTITAILQACGVDFNLEIPLMVESKLDLHALQRKHFLCGRYEQSTNFGYLFTPPYDEEAKCILLPHKDLPALSDGNNYLKPPRSTWFYQCPGCALVGVSLYHQSKARITRKERSSRPQGDHVFQPSTSHTPPHETPFSAATHAKFDEWLRTSFEDEKEKRLALEAKVSKQGKMISKLVKVVKKSVPHLF